MLVHDNASKPVSNITFIESIIGSIIHQIVNSLKDICMSH